MDLTRIRRENPAFNYGFSGLIRLPSGVRLAKMPDMAVTLPVQAARNKPKLLDQVRDVIRRKHFSLRIERAYADRSVPSILAAT